MIGKAIAALPGFTHCSSGDFIRAAIGQAPDASDQWNKVAAGQLLADDQLWVLFDQFLTAYKRISADVAGEDLLLLDGIPRSRCQVEELSERVTVRGVLHFVCDDQEALVHRIALRFRQSDRIDDASKEIIRTRLRIYNEQTLPLLDQYPPDAIHRIDSAQHPQVVLGDALTLLDRIYTPTDRHHDPVA